MIKMIPEGWVKIKLGDIGKFSTSSVDKKSIEGEEEVYMLNYMDIYNHSTLTEDYPFEKVTAPRKQVLSSSVQRGDVFFTPSSETPDDIGHSAVFIGDLENIVHSYHTIRFRSVSNEYLDDHFKSHVFQGVDTYEYFRKRASGSTRFTLSLPVFNELELTVPSLPEQKKIASILSSVDEAIKTTQKKIDKLQDLKKGLMNELLTKGIGHTEFKDSELGRIPKSWVVKKLEEISIVPITKGSTPSTYGYEWTTNGILFLRSESVKMEGFSLSGSMRISNKANNSLRRSQVLGGDILVAITGYIGSICVYPDGAENANINQHIARIRIPDNITRDFVAFFLSTDRQREKFLAIQTGQAYPQLSLKQIQETCVCLPSEAERDKISKILSNHHSHIRSLKENKIHLEKLKKSLMQDLLTGKVRVKVN